jgi:hypothetical protein
MVIERIYINDVPQFNKTIRFKKFTLIIIFTGVCMNLDTVFVYVEIETSGWPINTKITLITFTLVKDTKVSDHSLTLVEFV